MAEGINLDKGIIEQEIIDISSKQQYSLMNKIINNTTTISAKINCENFLEDGDRVRVAYNECIVEYIKDLEELWETFAEVDKKALN